MNRQQFDTRLARCIDQLRRRGVSALGELYDLTSRRLLRFAMVLTSDQTDAEDILQTALLRIARKPQRLVAADHPWPYLVRIVRNEAISHGRRRRPQRLPTDCDVPATIDWDPVETADRRESVQAAVAQLPAAQSEVVVLKVWEEMTFLEIAEVLNESPNTVASRYRYALEKLARSLHPYSPEVVPR